MLTVRGWASIFDEEPVQMAMETPAGMEGIQYVDLLFTKTGTLRVNAKMPNGGVCGMAIHGWPLGLMPTEETLAAHPRIAVQWNQVLRSIAATILLN